MFLSNMLPPSQTQILQAENVTQNISKHLQHIVTDNTFSSAQTLRPATFNWPQKHTQWGKVLTVDKGHSDFPNADLQKVFVNKIKRVQACIDARGHHFQHLLYVHSDFPNKDLQKVFANKIRWVQACTDAHGHHFQHLS
jgi:hypothetical protein